MFPLLGEIPAIKPFISWSVNPRRFAVSCQNDNFFKWFPNLPRLGPQVRPESQSFRAEGMKKKLRISNAADKKLVHRWLKGSFATVLRLMQWSDGSLSGSVSEMLESMSDQMESVYNQHMDWDTPSQIEYFHEQFTKRFPKLVFPVWMGKTFGICPKASPLPRRLVWTIGHIGNSSNFLCQLGNPLSSYVNYSWSCGRMAEHCKIYHCDLFAKKGRTCFEP